MAPGRDKEGLLGGVATPVLSGDEESGVREVGKLWGPVNFPPRGVEEDGVKGDSGIGEGMLLDVEVRLGKGAVSSRITTRRGSPGLRFRGAGWWEGMEGAGVAESFLFGEGVRRRARSAPEVRLPDGGRGIAAMVECLRRVNCGVPERERGRERESNYKREGGRERRREGGRGGGREGGVEGGRKGERE